MTTGLGIHWDLQYIELNFTTDMKLEENTGKRPESYQAWELTMNFFLIRKKPKTKKKSIEDFCKSCLLFILSRTMKMRIFLTWRYILFIFTISYNFHTQQS